MKERISMWSFHELKHALLNEHRKEWFDKGSFHDLDYASIESSAGMEWNEKEQKTGSYQAFSVLVVSLIVSLVKPAPVVKNYERDARF